MNKIQYYILVESKTKSIAHVYVNLIDNVNLFDERSTLAHVNIYEHIHNIRQKPSCIEVT